MRVRKCCIECSKRRKKVSECRPRGPGRKCWSCEKWNRECSFVHDYPESLKDYVIEPSREEKRAMRERAARAARAAREAGGAIPAADDAAPPAPPAPPAA